MDPERLARYADKLAHASARLRVFLEWAPAADRELKDRLACYKALQESAEALMDVSAMLVRDAGRVPKDDYTNLTLLRDEGLLTPRSAEVLREFNGLRNRLVHEYGSLSDEIAIASGRRLAGPAAAVIEEVRVWLSKS